MTHVRVAREIADLMVCIDQQALIPQEQLQRSRSLLLALPINRKKQCIEQLIAVGIDLNSQHGVVVKPLLLQLSQLIADLANSLRRPIAPKADQRAVNKILGQPGPSIDKEPASGGTGISLLDLLVNKRK